MSLDRANSDLVHHLERRGHDAATDHSRHRLAGGIDAGKGGKQGRDRRRNAQEPHLDLGDRAQGALRSDQHSAQVKADAIRRISADPVHAAIRQHDLHPEDVIRGHAVVEAMRPARVLGRVATDSACLLAGWIGRIEKLVWRRGERQLLVDHPGLDQRCLSDRVDLEDPAHAGHLQRDAPANGHGATRQPGAGAAGDDGDVVARGDLDHSRHLLGVRRQHDGVRHRAFNRPVALEDAQVVGGGDHVVAAGDLFQLTDHRGWQRHQASGASRSGLRSKASNRRVIEPGKPGASTASAPTTSSLNQRWHSSSPGIRSLRSKMASWMRLCGETWIVYHTLRPSWVTAWWVSSTRRLTGSFMGLASAAARSRAASSSIGIDLSLLTPP